MFRRKNTSFNLNGKIYPEKFLNDFKDKSLLKFFIILLEVDVQFIESFEILYIYFFFW